MTETATQRSLRHLIHFLVDSSKESLVNLGHYVKTYPESDGITEEWLRETIAARQLHNQTKCPPNNDTVFVEGVAK